jgi:hypothetical protein
MSNAKLRILNVKSLFLLAVLFLTACSGSPPDITEVRYRLTAFSDRDTGRTSEYLSVAVLAVDDDGQDDFESISIINDDEELYWQAASGEWVVRQARQQSWLVLERIAAPPIGVLPRGRYRVIVRDYAGSQAENSFTITVSKEMPQSFPALELSAPVPGEKAALVLSSERNESILMVRSGAGALLGSFILKKGVNSRDAILANEQIRAQAKDLFLWEQGAAGGLSLLAGPWPAEELLFSSAPRE